MTILDRVLGRAELPQASQLENPQYPISGTGILEALGIGSSVNHVQVTPQSALGMSAVWRSQNLIAGGCAALPLHAYKKGEPNPDGQTPRVLQTTGQAAQLLDQPHPDLTPFEFWELVYVHVLGWGNAYVQKLRDQAGIVRELWPVHPSRIRAGRASDMTKVYELDGQVPLTDRQIMHIPGFGFDGIVGLSPIGMARNGIGLSLAAEQFGKKLFENGSLAGGILSTEQRLDQTRADSLKERWKARAAGLDNAHDIVVLDAGAKFQQLSIPPDDAQFLETRSFQIEEVARIYGVPPHLLMSTEKSTSWGTGLEQNTIAFVTYTLRPWLTRVEQRVTQILSPAPVYAKYAVDGLLRGDSAARSAFYNTMWNLGALSTNEIRAYEELAPVEGGDTRYRPLNMGGLGTTDSSTDAKEPARAS